ncbi:UDP-glucose/GDP-mannose dehydrogenase family protein [candidate division KSB1 bacterium]|nr:MAG: UDP-glucose/GDP-mannose dehydrogenase family protein [candidate division KSB1 bacterium]
MKLVVIGTGYVGLVTGACLAETGHDVVCVDIDEKKIAALKSGKIPIYEPGLEEILARNIAKSRLHYTTDLISVMDSAEILMIAVGTPPNEDGTADLSHVLKAAETIGRNMKSYKIVVNKSTVPVGSADLVKAKIREYTKLEFDVVSNPEFLKEGDAVNDFMKPDRIVLGVEGTRAEEAMRHLYGPFQRTGHRLIVMDIRSAEMTKYAANALLATKITFMNEIANLCEKLGADVTSVRYGIGADPRIGSQFLFPGVGYGGSCFPKDVAALNRIGLAAKNPLKVLQAVEEVNERQRHRIAEKVLAHFGEDLKGKTFAVWGLAFKPRTDDMREAPSIYTINDLLSHGAKIQGYDPAAMREAEKIFGDRITLAEDGYRALTGADALLILTEWQEFRDPDFDRIKKELKNPVIFDGRNLFEPADMRAMGFQYFCIGRV